MEVSFDNYLGSFALRTSVPVIAPFNRKITSVSFETVKALYVNLFKINTYCLSLLL